MFWKESWLAIVVVQLQSLLLIIVCVSVFTANDFTALKIRGIPFLALAALVMAILSIITIKNIERNARYQAEAFLLKNHLQQVEDILRDSRMQRHEFSRHLQIIQSMVEMGKFEEASYYIEGIGESLMPAEELVYTPNPALSALINSKCSLARRQNIDFAIALKTDISRIAVPDWELCSMVGNLLDNAFEAAATAERPRVGLEFLPSENFCQVEVSNNGANIDQTDLDRIFEAGFSLKGSEGRGYGLFIVQRLALQYGGSVELISRQRIRAILRLPLQTGGENG